MIQDGNFLFYTSQLVKHQMKLEAELLTQL